MNKDINFSKTALIHSSKESLWKVLLSEQLYNKAWGAVIKTTWVAGSDIQFRGIWEGVTYIDKGVVQINDEYSILKFSYWSSFWDVADDPDEYCFITFKVHALDSMTCECTITQEGFRDEKHHADTVELLIKTLDTIKLEAERYFLASFSGNVFGKLIPLIESADQEVYNEPVREGWSPAQVTEHVIMSSSSLEQFLGEAISSSTEYDRHVREIRGMMINMMKKFRTPEALVPPLKAFDQKLHTHQLCAISSEISHCIETLDFTRRCESYPMPPFGLMSIFEWLTFTVYHIARHTSQIEMLMKKNRM